MFDASGSTTFAFELFPDVKVGSALRLFWERHVERGVVDLLGTDGLYHALVIGESGLVGDPVPNLGGPIGAVTSAPGTARLQIVSLLSGAAQLTTLDPQTATVMSPTAKLSFAEAVTKIVGGATHPKGWSVVLWNTPMGLTGRLLPP